VRSTILLIMGALVADVVRRGAGCISIASDAHAPGQMTATSFIIGIIPSSITDAFARNNMLQVIVFVVLFGIRHRSQ
jgi:aerobic C4-dicarboxylate transport protein